MSDMARAFWNTEFAKEAPSSNMHEGVHKIVADAVHFFGSLKGKKVLDLGCGSGGASVLLAHYGADVTAVDFSPTAIRTLNTYIATHSISNIRAIEYDAMKIGDLGQFDFVFGALILHHLEPFSKFCDVLRLTLKEGGAAFFHENNAASNVLIWCRRNIVGKFWVPRYGDEDEFPLMPKEVDMLRKRFEVQVVIPEMLFFQLVSVYVLRRRFRSFTRWLDHIMLQFNIGTKYSYRQNVLIRG